MWRRRIAVVAVLGVAVAAAGIARAQVKVEIVPADTAAPSYSVSIRDATLTEAIAQFTKQTGIDLVFEEQNSSDMTGGPSVVFDVDFTNLGRTEAVREFARSVSLGVQPNNGNTGPFRLSRGSWSNDQESRDTPGVILTYINRNESFPPNPNQPNTMNLQFRLFGGRQAITGTSQLEVTEAVDENGNKLEAPDRGRMTSSYDGGGNRSSVDVSRQLTLPSPTPKKLVKLRGTATLMRPKTFLRVTADKLGDKAVDGDFDGGTISIGPSGPAQDDPKRLELPLNFTKGTMTNDRWTQLQRQINTLMQNAEIRGVGGERLWLQSRGWSSSGETINVRALVTRNSEFSGRQEANKPLPAPEKFKWDVVAETVGEPVPFEFNDVELP